MNGHANGESNGHSKSHSSSSKHKHKDKERERRKETEEERKIRKQKEKEKPKNETEEQRKERKERERKERDDKYRKEGKRPETEEERKIRKEKERKEREDRAKKEGKRLETDEERRIRKEKEKNRDRKDGKRSETEEERRIRKEKERKDRDKSEKDGRRKETEEERRERKERERRERKEKEERQVKVEVKEEPMEAETSAHDEESAQESTMEQDVKEEPDETYQEEEEEEEKPLKRKRKSYKEEDDDEDFQAEQSEDEQPARKKKKKNIKKEVSDDDEDDFKASKKKAKANKAKKQQQVKREVPTPTQSPTKKKGVKKEDEKEVWKWWEEKDKKPEGVKWFFLEHNGPLFAPLYEPLPDHVKFYYDGKKMRLSEPTEECATFYGRMLDHDYTTKEVFNKNFMKDWRKVMTDKEKEIIRDLSKCDFSEMNEHFKAVSEQRKNRSKEEKKAEKVKNEELAEHYGFCEIDGHKEKIGNFRIEPPGLFRGRGEHPKQGMLKRRVMPEDVIINCSKDSDFPSPPEGHKWKEVRHDNTVTWLASWTENIQNQIKYVMLNPSSKLKGEKDMMKYEKARQLKAKIDKIRENYIADFKSKEMRVRQRSVAMYFIDKLALRAGNEKDDDQADTVGCCSLRCEHITLHEEKDDKQFVVEFDFLGKDSIRYHNDVAVEKRVFKNLAIFKEGKKGGDDLFDRLNTSILNEHLNKLMDGLTAKVFRTYNASITLQEQLKELTDADDNVAHKTLSYNRANRAVAILCNHQRAVPKMHEKGMNTLNEKIEAKKELVEKAEKEFKKVKKAVKGGQGSKAELDKKKKAVERLMEQLQKLETQAVDKEENKTIALGTSKLNYLDPRITVAWCKKFEVPIEKVYTKTHRDKFRWAIEMAGPDYEF